jgi:hypothetical protein
MMIERNDVSAGILIALLAALLSALAWSSCSSCSGNAGDDTDTSTGADGDSDTDGDTDADADQDADADSDSDADSDADQDADADADSDTDSDTDGDGDTDLPVGCQLITPSNENAGGWSAREAMDNDYLTWRWVDVGDQSVLMIHRLSTGEQFELLRRPYPLTITYPSVFGDTVFFERKTDQLDTWSSEVFSIGISETEEVQLTDNSFAEGSCSGGASHVVAQWGGAGPGERGLKAVSLNTLDEDVFLSATTIDTKVFDGTKWVSYIRILNTEFTLWKYDITNPDAGVQQVEPSTIGAMWMAANPSRPETVVGAGIQGITERLDIVVWNLETNERTIVVNDPWDQGGPDAHGNLITYIDSQANNAQWFGNYKGEVRVVDRDTLVKRVVLPLSTYWGVAIWDHWVATNNAGPWGDIIILCDLLEMGIVDADNNVIPEDAPDAGPDASPDGGK